MTEMIDSGDGDDDSNYDNDDENVDNNDDGNDDDNYDDDDDDDNDDDNYDDDTSLESGVALVVSKGGSVSTRGQTEPPLDGSLQHNLLSR